MLMRNTTAVVIITLGFMTFGVWHERDSGKAGGGGRNLVTFSNERAQNWGVRPHFVCIKWCYTPKQEIFIMVFTNYRPALQVHLVLILILIVRILNGIILGYNMLNCDTIIISLNE